MKFRVTVTTTVRMQSFLALIRQHLESDHTLFVSEFSVRQPHSVVFVFETNEEELINRLRDIGSGKSGITVFEI